MVIQRWQSVLLLLATIFMVLLCVLPLGSGVSDINNPDSSTPIRAIDILPLFIIGIVSAIILLISIFCYKNLNLQKRTIIAGCILLVPAIVISAIYSLWLAVLFSALALLASVWAYTRVSADQKLLRSYDRLR